MIKAADLFCGAGGTSLGARQTGEVDVRFALNHWDRAIETHSANFPETKHVQTELKWTHPSECEKINLLFASPECTHHSKARGGRPTSNQQRSGAWEIMPWIEYHRPSMVVVENVMEFEDWGPVGDNGKPLKSFKGKFFNAWVSAIQSAGYRVEFNRLNAADFGAATSRTRLFIVARKGRRAVHWPDPTHSKSTDAMLPGFERDAWRGAIEIIDWELPIPSVFGRRKPLADKTLARIEKGLRRHVEPFVVKLRTHGTDYPLGNPIGTITAGGLHHGLSVPFIATVNHGDDGRSGKRTKDSRDPLGVITTSNGRALVTPYFVPRHGERPGQSPRSHSSTEPLPTIACSNAASLAVPYVVQFDNQSSNAAPRSNDQPIGTITTKNGQAIALPLVMAPQGGGVAKTANNPVPTITTMAGSQVIVPWISSYYGTHNDSKASNPVPTIVTKDRHALVTAKLPGLPIADPQTDMERQLLKTMKELGVIDIGFRMLSNGELADAQGFPMDYKFCGTKKDVTKQIGNSVSPNVAEAITRSLLG